MNIPLQEKKLIRTLSILMIFKKKITFFKIKIGKKEMGKRGSFKNCRF